MNVLQEALVVDLSVIVVCLSLLMRFGNLTFSHPAVSYIIFHIYVVPLRLFALGFGGAPTLFSTWQGVFDPVLPEEIARAALYFDVALAAMTVAWLLLRRFTSVREHRPTPLNPTLVWFVIIVAFPVGIWGLLVGAQLPGFQSDAYRGAMNLGEWQSSSYIFITQTWCGLALLAYIYCYGLKRLPVALLIAYLLIMTFQGYHRFRVVIPVLMLAQIWLDRRQLRWPPRFMIAGFLLVIALFFPLKTIGRMWQTGTSVSEIGSVIADSTQRVIAGEGDDQMFLDQLASTLTLADMNGRRFWGEMYLALLTLPVPRQWWPEKPSVADFITEISVPSRPMKECGMTVTFIGEAYANFGLTGVILVPPILAGFLTLFYRRAYRAGYGTVLRFGYVLLSVNLIQVYRDGLTSLVVFTFVNTLPLMAIVLLHLISRWLPFGRTVADPRVGQNA